MIRPTKITFPPGLRFLGDTGDDGAATVIGSSILTRTSATGRPLPATANFNLLMGIDPSSDDLAALQARHPFVLLVLQDTEGKY